FMVALVNLLNADVWFTVPHMATNDYNNRAAALVRDMIAPHLKVYVEYSNETWNGGFGQARYVEQQGSSRGLSGSTAYDKGRHFHVTRTVEVGNIWKQVFGNRSGQIDTVLGAHSANSYWSGKMLAFNNLYR